MSNQKNTIQDPSLKIRLTPLQYKVAVENATEPPFDNAYHNKFEKGIYVDIVNGKPLFVSNDKFESGCGWPAFSKPIDPNLITKLPDNSHGMTRTEVRSTDADTHLGHIFSDGPKELGGMRYCINSASLRFVPLDKMDQEGYGDFKSLVH